MPAPWLDAILKNTRGMLFWHARWIELVRIVVGLSQPQAWQLIQSHLQLRPNAVPALQQTHYSGAGQHMMQIIEERSPGLAPRSAPDYLAGHWLAACLTKSVGVCLFRELPVVTESSRPLCGRSPTLQYGHLNGQLTP